MHRLFFFNTLKTHPLENSLNVQILCECIEHAERCCVFRRKFKSDLLTFTLYYTKYVRQRMQICIAFLDGKWQSNERKEQKKNPVSVAQQVVYGVFCVYPNKRSAPVTQDIYMNYFRINSLLDCYHSSVAPCTSSHTRIYIKYQQMENRMGAQEHTATAKRISNNYKIDFCAWKRTQSTVFLVFIFEHTHQHMQTDTCNTQYTIWSQVTATHKRQLKILLNSWKCSGK